ncbi:MAG: CsgG/HfaB family protein [Candidatus Edwardsbacteria bacterium]|nr:CsgG/HfaB family protein [Candidatus Edwardsbacteria bacterium]
MKHVAMIALLLSAAAAPLQAQAAKKTAVAVMSLRGSAIADADARFLTERLNIELQRTGIYDVLERDKMDEILKEQGFQQTGACDETACLVEAGRLLPVEKMIGGSVGKIGNVFSAQIRLIDLKTGKVEKTATRDYKGELDYLLTTGMRESAEELSGKIGQQAQAQAQPAAATPQTEVMMRNLIQVQIEKESKSRGWATIWSLVIPGLGNLYATNYWGSALYFTAAVTAQSAYTAQTRRGNKSGAGGWVLAYLAVRGIDIYVANRSVSRYNAKVRRKYGLSWDLTPFDQRPALAFTGTF